MRTVFRILSFLVLLLFFVLYPVDFDETRVESTEMDVRIPESTWKDRDTRQSQVPREQEVYRRVGRSLVPPESNVLPSQTFRGTTEPRPRRHCSGGGVRYPVSVFLLNLSSSPFYL